MILAEFASIENERGDRVSTSIHHRQRLSVALTMGLVLSYGPLLAICLADSPTTQSSSTASKEKPRIQSDNLELRDYSAILKSQAIRQALGLSEDQQKQLDRERDFMDRRLDAAADEPLYGPNPTVELLERMKQLLMWTGQRARNVLDDEQDVKYQALFDQHRLSPIALEVAVASAPNRGLGFETYHQVEVQWPQLASAAAPTSATTAPASAAVLPPSPTTAPDQSAAQAPAAPNPAESSAPRGKLPDWVQKGIERELPSGCAATNIVGGSGGGLFVDASTEQGPVFGLRVTLGHWMHQPVIRRIAPLYESANPPSGTAVVYARPGYIVDAVLADYGDNLNAVRVRFARWKDGKIDLSDTYDAHWIGIPAGEAQELLGGTTSPVMGICGRHGLNMDAFGLVIADASGHQ